MIVKKNVGDFALHDLLFTLGLVMATLLLVMKTYGASNASAEERSLNSAIKTLVGDTRSETDKIDISGLFSSTYTLQKINNEMVLSNSGDVIEDDMCMMSVIYLANTDPENGGVWLKVKYSLAIEYCKKIEDVISFKIPSLKDI